MEGCWLPEIIVHISSFLDIIEQSRLKQVCRLFSEFVSVDLGGKSGETLRKSWTELYDSTTPIAKTSLSRDRDNFLRACLWRSIYYNSVENRNVRFLKLCLESKFIEKESHGNVSQVIWAAVAHCGT